MLRENRCKCTRGRNHLQLGVDRSYMATHNGVAVEPLVEYPRELGDQEIGNHHDILSPM